MIRLILKVLLVFASGVFFYCGIIWLFVLLGLSNWLPNFYSTTGGLGQMLVRMREVQQVKKDYDFLFIGSSHAYRSFDTREFNRKGITAFNLGSTSQTPFNSYYLLKEYLPTIKPEVVVLDLYWNMLTRNGVESTIDIVSNTEINNTIGEMAASTKDGMVLHSVMSNIILRIHKPLHQLEQQHEEEEKYIAGGFIETHIKKNKLSVDELNRLEYNNLTFSERQLDYLHKIIQLCHQNQIKLVFVVTPVTKEFKSKVLNYAEYKSLITSIAKKHNIPLLDYNSRSELKLHSINDFYDRDHLTQSGVLKFNNLLLNDLEKLEVINTEIQHPSHQERKKSIASAKCVMDI